MKPNVIPTALRRKKKEYKWNCWEFLLSKPTVFSAGKIPEKKLSDKWAIQDSLPHSPEGRKRIDFFFSITFYIFLEVKKKKERKKRRQSTLSRGVLDTCSNLYVTGHLRHGRRGEGSGPCQTERAVWGGSPEWGWCLSWQGAFGWLRTCTLLRERRKHFQFLEYRGFLDRVFPGVTPDAKGEGGEKTLHLSGYCLFQGIQQQGGEI